MVTAGHGLARWTQRPGPGRPPAGAASAAREPERHFESRSPGPQRLQVGPSLSRLAPCVTVTVTAAGLQAGSLSTTERGLRAGLHLGSSAAGPTGSAATVGRGPPTRRKASVKVFVVGVAAGEPGLPGRPGGGWAGWCAVSLSGGNAC
jgi:hypothetical protein